MKVYMETLGCPKNFNDTQVAKGIMVNGGIEIVDEIESADVMILNTCGFINDAKKESIDRIFELADYKEMGKKLPKLTPLWESTNTKNFLKFSISWKKANLRTL